MERHREPVEYRWEGPFPKRDLPEEVLYDVVLVFDHDGEREAPVRLKRSLDSLAGRGRLRRLPLLGAHVSARGGRWRLSARLRNGSVRVQVHHRLKGKALGQLVEALSAVPGARDLRIVAAQERFAKPYTSVGPCSPCAAGRFVGRG